MISRRNMLAVAAVLVTAGAAGAYLLRPDPAEAGQVYEGAIPGVAINGYDAVAYLNERAPVEGSPDHTFDWRGATWRFASTANRDAFATDPERYAPQYGGFCAFAMAQGQKVRTDPAAFSVVGGKLYLNYDAPVRTRWEADRDGYIAAANERWPKVAQ